MKLSKKIRRNSGLTIVALLALVTIFIIGPLSVFVFEVARYNLSAQQLKNCLDSAALAAACSTTGSNSSSASVTQTQAMNAAMYMFQQNEILDKQLTSTPAPAGYGVSSPVWTPVANQAQLYFQFLDPVTKMPVPYGSVNGKILRVFGTWGFVPITAKFVGLAPGPYLIQDQSDGGLPQLDVVLCFDISSSMDDFTNVTLLNRYASGSQNAYALTGSDGTIINGNPSGHGPLYYAVGASYYLGISDNATWPMDINSSGGAGNPQGVYAFNTAGYGAVNGPAPALTSGPYQFTDCVVNLDGTATQSAGVNINGFSFPSDNATHLPLGIMVEAMRGNLESVAAATAAHVPYAAMGVTPRPGWFQAYYQGVMSASPGFPTSTPAIIPLRHPIGDAIVAAENFFSILNNDADCHFGLVTFSSKAGTSATSTVPGTYRTLMAGGSTTPSSYPYPAPDPVSTPNPGIVLNPTAGPSYSNFSTSPMPPTTSVNGALFAQNSNAAPYNFTTVVAEGGTNIAEALDTAIAQHLGSVATDPATTPQGLAGMAKSRPGATRAIVLFTDGLPNSPPDSGTSDPQSQAEATFAKGCGIPIYTIGLSMVPSLQASQTTVLTDASGSTGIAWLSGNGATFSQTTSAAQLNAVFQNVARQLVQLVQ